MAAGTRSLGGISVRLQVNAAEVKSAIDTLPKQVKVKVSVERDASFAALKKELSNLPVTLKATANVASVRALRTSITQQIAGAGGIRVPANVLFTKAAGATARRQIEAAIGQPKITLQLAWEWGPGGPPPAGATAGPGGGGGSGPATGARAEAAAATGGAVPAGGALGVASEAVKRARVRLTVEQRLARDQEDLAKLEDRLTRTTSASVIARTRRRLTAVRKRLGMPDEYAAGSGPYEADEAGRSQQAIRVNAAGRQINARGQFVARGDRAAIERTWPNGPTENAQGRIVKTAKEAGRQYGAGPVIATQEGELDEGALFPGERPRRRGERVQVGFTGARGAQRPGSIPVINTAELHIDTLVRNELARHRVGVEQQASLVQALTKAGGQGILGPIVREVQSQIDKGNIAEARAIATQSYAEMECQARRGEIPGLGATPRAANKLVGRLLSRSTKGRDPLEALLGEARPIEVAPTYEKGVRAGQTPSGRFYDIRGRRTTAAEIGVTLPGTGAITGTNLTPALFGVQMRALQDVIAFLKSPEVARTTAKVKTIDTLGVETRAGGFEERPRGTFTGPVKPDKVGRWRIGTQPVMATSTVKTAVTGPNMDPSKGPIGDTSEEEAIMEARRRYGAPTKIDVKRRVPGREIRYKALEEAEAAAAAPPPITERRNAAGRLIDARGRFVAGGQPAPEEPISMVDRAVKRNDAKLGRKISAIAAENVTATPPVGPGGPGAEGGEHWGGGTVPVRVTNVGDFKSVFAGAAGTRGKAVAAQPVTSDDILGLIRQTSTGAGGPAAAPQIGATFGKELSEAVRLGHITPERARELTAPQFEPRPIDAAIQGVREQLAAARQGLPIRSAPQQFGQLLAGPERGKITARFEEAVKYLGQAQTVQNRIDKLTTQQTGHQEQLNAIKQKGTDITKREQQLLVSLPEALKREGGELDKLREARTGLVSQAKQLADLTFGEKAANVGRTMVGQITGTLIYATAIGAVTGGLALLAKGLSPVIERTLGYQNVSAALTNTLADQQQQQGGNVKTLVANQLAQTNMSKATADAIAPTLEQKAATQASAKAIEQQTEFLAAGFNAQQAARQGGGRLSTNPDLYTSSGGLFGTSLFAPQQSIQEVLGNQLRQASREDTQGILNQAFQRAPGPLQGLGQILGTGFGAAGISITQPGGQGGPNFKAFQDDVDRAGLGLKAVKGSADDVQKTVDALNGADLKEFAAGAAASGLSLQGLSKDSATAQLQVTQLAEKLAKINASRNVDQLIAGASDQIKATFVGIQQDLQLALKTSIPAGFAQQQLAQPLQPFGAGILPLQRVAPGAGGGAFAPSPGGAVPGLFGAPTEQLGLNVGGKQQFGGIPPEAIQTFSQYRSAATAAFDAVEQKVKEGEAAMANAGVPPSVISGLESMRTQIQNINVEEAGLQQNLALTEYNHQLYLANRQLGDLAGLTGRQGATFIGQLERQELLLGRRGTMLGLQSQQLGLQSQQLSQQSAIIGQESTKLQLELSQRQINFQLATAGFVAPGTTPEERHARVEEAKIEASYAQKQLDFQKQQYALQQQQIGINAKNLVIAQAQYVLAEAQFKNQVALQDATNNRAYQDQLATIAELHKNFKINLEIQGLESVKAALTQQQTLLSQQAQAYQSAGEQWFKAENQFATQLMTATGQFTTQLVDTVDKAFIQMANDFESSGLGQLLGYQNAPTQSATGGETPNYSGKTKNIGTYAGGGLMNVSQPSTMTVGEAGNETVAVIANPHTVPIGTGGGGGQPGMNLQVVFNNPVVRQEADIEKMVDMLVVKLEEKLGKRGAMFGFSVVR